MAKLPTPTNGAEINNYFIPQAGQGSLTNSENVYFWRVDLNVGQKDHFYYTYWWQYSRREHAIEPARCPLDSLTCQSRERTHSAPQLGTHFQRR